MQVTRVSTSEQLAKLAREWNALPCSSPFQSWEWLATWWQHYGERRELFVLSVRDEVGRLSGLLPLYLERQSARGRVLQWLGSGEVCTDYLSVIAAERDSLEVADALASWLLNAAHSHSEQRWDVLELDNVLAGDEAVSRLVERLTAAGCGAHCNPGLSCWRLPLPSSWEKLTARYNKSQLRRVRRAVRNAFDQGRTVLHAASQTDELPAAMDLLVKLHQKRWQSLGKPGCFASRRFDSFLREVALRLHSTDRLNLCWVELEGTPVAIEFALVDERSTYIYQGGIDPDQRDKSPGHLMTMALIQDAIARSHRTYDWLRGDEPYKAEWGAIRHPTFCIRVSSNRVSSQLRHSVWVAGLTMKSWVRGGLSLAGMR